MGVDTNTGTDTAEQRIAEQRTAEQETVENSEPRDSKLRDSKLRGSKLQISKLRNSALRNNELQHAVDYSENSGSGIAELADQQQWTIVKMRYWNSGPALADYQIL